MGPSNHLQRLWRSAGRSACGYSGNSDTPPPASRHGDSRRALEIIHSGGIGAPLALRMRLGGGFGGWPVPLSAWMWRLNESEGGGGATLFDDGYHKFSVAIDFFGEVRKVSGWIDWSFKLIDAPAALLWQHSNGVVGTMDAALTPNFYLEGQYYSADERIEITGSEGTIYLQTCTSRPSETAALIVDRGGRSEHHGDIEQDWLASFVASGQDFISAILDDREPKLTGERGMEVTAFALAVYESAKNQGAWTEPTR